MSKFAEKISDAVRLAQGFPRCPKCGAVMDWDVEVNSEGEMVPDKGYFFCWNDDTEIPDNRDLTDTQQKSDVEK
jgi:hypothetical protein